MAKTAPKVEKAFLAHFRGLMLLYRMWANCYTTSVSGSTAFAAGTWRIYMGDLNATSQIDQIIQGYDAVSLAVYISLAVVVVALLALGTEFWVNIWGCIFYPAMTFQRLLGEAQWVPGIVVVGVAGLSSAMIFLSYISDPGPTEWFSKIDLEAHPLIYQAFTGLDSVLEQVGWNKSLVSIFKYMQGHAFQANTMAVVVPVAFILLWLVWGLAGQLASMIAGNKGGHGLTNLWSAVPYTFLIWILSTWLFCISLYGRGAARLLFWVSLAYFLFEHIVMMREHGRYRIQSAVVATILTLVLVAAFVFILVVGGIAIAVQAENYL